MRTLSRLSLAMLGLLGTAVLPPAPVHASPAGTVCELQGVVQIDPPGLTMTGAGFTYSLSAELSSSVSSSTAACASTIPTAPTGTQTFNAGKAYEVTVSGSGWSVTYALPQATGYGSCAESMTQGVAVAAWPDGSFTVVDYATVGVASTWVLGGEVARSAKLHEVSSTGTPPASTPTTYTVNTTNPAFPVGTPVGGEFAFISVIGDPTCSGTTFGGLTGAIELGGA